jgi:hypothetical protein
MECSSAALAAVETARLSRPPTILPRNIFLIIEFAA